MLRNKMLAAVLTLTFIFGLSSMAMAVTQEEINQSIDDGVAWLVDQQNPADGSWSGCVARTGFAVIKLEERAFELGNSPFDPGYPYKAAIENGLDFIFTQAVEVCNGIAFPSPWSWNHTYNTGIAMMAIAASKVPNRLVTAAGAVNGWTYKEVLQANVDFFACSQNPDGGWRYEPGVQESDNSNTGYAVLGLAYAQAPVYGFSCTIPDSVKTGLNSWINTIQDPVNGDTNDGGSWYTPTWSWVNILKTGNLVFEMTFVGDPTDPPSARMQDALDYIVRHWDDQNQDPGWKGPPPHYQAMYCVMKGMTYAGIETIGDIDWYDDFATAIVVNQQTDGSWPWDQWGDQMLATEWALLALEAISPPQPEPEGQWVYAGESFDPIDLDEWLRETGTPPYEWSFEDTENVTVEISDDNIATITYPEDWYGAETVIFTVTDAQGQQAVAPATFTVIGVPVVEGIPDQSAPFEPFELDDYLSGMKPEDVEWTASEPGSGWTVDINADGIVTVTAPEDATEPVTITFTATSNACPEWWINLGNAPPSDSDDATFTPVIIASIEIKPETLNLKSKGVFTAFIDLPEGYNEEEIDVSTVECEGASALSGVIADDGKLVVKFDREDLDDVPIGDAVELAVTGRVTDGPMFKGTDTIRVIDSGKGKGSAAPAAPLAFAAPSAYPQPCNPETWIPYTLAKDVEVTITIYSSSGRIIRTLRLGYQKAGAYISKSRAVHWDGRNESGERVTSGLYFYTIKAGEFIATRKLVVLR